MKMRVILKSGAQFDADVTEFIVKRSTVDGGITELNWTHGGKNRLNYLRLDDVVAVLRVD